MSPNIAGRINGIGEPLIDFYLYPTTVFVDALKKENLEAKIPRPIKVTALIDTGFRNGLVIQRNLVVDWGLEPKNMARFNGIRPDTETGEAAEAYIAWESDVAIRFLSDPNVLIDPVPAGLVDLSGETEFQAIIGCQILKLASVIYEGPQQKVKLILHDPRKAVRPKRKSGG